MTRAQLVLCLLAQQHSLSPEGITQVSRDVKRLKAGELHETWVANNVALIEQTQKSLNLPQIPRAEGRSPKRRRVAQEEDWQLTFSRREFDALGRLLQLEPSSSFDLGAVNE